MSRCDRCDREMHPADAAQWLICPACLHGMSESQKQANWLNVRNLNRFQTEQIGRRPRSTQVIGGSAEIGSSGDDPEDKRRCDDFDS